jgi:hypothetical protein
LLLAVAVCTGLLGGALGWWVGAASSPIVAVAPGECPEPEEVAVQGADAERMPNAAMIEALERSLQNALMLASRLDSLERLSDEVDRQGLATAEAADLLIDGMRDADLPILARMLSGLSEHELDQLEDLRGFSRRLAEVTISGELGEAQAEAGSDRAVIQLLFSSEEELLNPSLVATDAFRSDSGPIFAIVRTGDLEDRTLMVRWARLDRPKVLSLRAHPVTAGSHWTALAQVPAGRWGVGRYRVSVYRLSAEMEELASAVYSVTP